MKRSQMLEIIAEALLETYGGDLEERNEVRDSSIINRLKRANIALTACEKAGMFPPATKASQWCWESEDNNRIENKESEKYEDIEMHQLEMEIRRIECRCPSCLPSQAY